MGFPVNVTRDDIDYGVPGQSDTCAIARAFMRIFPNAYEVDVGGTEDDLIIVHLDRNVLRFRMDEDAVEFIQMFDGTVDGEQDIKEYGDTWKPAKRDIAPRHISVEYVA